jgi:hypothetical protein
MVPFTTATAAFTGGDMFSEDLAIYDFVKVYVPSPDTIEAQSGGAKLSLKINAHNGKLSGTFLNHAGRLRPIRGILLQEQRWALGYFLSEKPPGYFLSGYFALVPNQ